MRDQQNIKFVMFFVVSTGLRILCFHWN